MKPGHTFNDFSEVRDLASPALEDLLRAGDGPERVWAAWTLGLREGAEAVPALVDTVGVSPDPGVRASLAVILAGHGRRDILEVLAVDDPDADVRASACRHLAGISLPQDPAVREFLEAKFQGDDAAPVWIVLLDLVNGDLLSIAPKELRKGLASQDVRVRRRAAEQAWVVWRRDGRVSEGTNRLFADEDPDLRGQMHDVALERVGPSGVVAMLGEATGLSDEVIRWHLRLLIAATAEASWDGISALAARGQDYDKDLLTLFDGSDERARPWLLRIMAGDDRLANLGLPKLALLLPAPPLSRQEVVDAIELRARIDVLVSDADEPDDWMDAIDLAELKQWADETMAVASSIDAAIASSRS